MKKFIEKTKELFKDLYRKMNGCESCGNKEYHVLICTEGGIRLCNECDPQTQHEIMIDLLNEQHKVLELIEEKTSTDRVLDALQELKDCMDKWESRQQKFKLLDLHGVVDTYPDKFVRLAKSITRTGGDVIICTGSSDNEKLQTQLLSYNSGIQWWTDIFSITDYLKSKNIPHTESADGGIKVENVLWDQAKGDWAREFDIDLHIDDSPEYGKYFDKGVYLKFNEREKR
jgi:hypothetical protein